ncbi:MAG: hypothetical protein QOG00_1495 [Pyrinomonadaceae bacterium]|nr:hypothetical protein [Pyrinomonadaceae bacterium]MDQ1611564.1 hypothetical protein [Pyrinomonadaceae bacterium]
MKYLIVAVIFGAFFTIIYLRLRPYINMARRVLGVVRDARGMSAGLGMPGGVSTAARPKPAGDERLVRCDSCGTWLPASRALTLRATSSNFCSHDCMERSAGESGARRAAR